MKEPFWDPSGVDLVEGIELGAVFLFMVLLENHRNNLFFLFVYIYVYIYTHIFIFRGEKKQREITNLDQTDPTASDACKTSPASRKGPSIWTHLVDA